MVVNNCKVTIGRKGDTSAEPEWIGLLLLHNDRWSGLRARTEGDFVALRLAGHVDRMMRATSRFKLGI